MADNTAWQNDGAEVYIKDKENKSLQHGVGYSGNSSQGKPYGALQGSQEIITRTADYWEVKITIPAEANNIDLTSEFLQIEVGINQAESGANCRSAQLFTWSAANHYKQGTNYGRVKLADCLRTIASETEICVGESISLTSPLISNNGKAYVWQWRTPENNEWTSMPPVYTISYNVIPQSNATEYRVSVEGISTCPVLITHLPCNHDECSYLPQIHIEEPTCDQPGTLTLMQDNTEIEYRVVWENEYGDSMGNAYSLTNISEGTYYAKINYGNCREKTITVPVNRNENGRGLQGSYNYGNSTIQQIDPVVDFDWEGEGEIRPQSVVWQGCLEVDCDENGGEYMFYIPEGGKLYINGELVIGEE
jgi:hypothetical protein